VTLYRVFPAVQGARPREAGGPLHVARHLQGSSRHDDPARYGALYTSRSAESAVAEALQAFRGRDIEPRHLVRTGRPLSLAEIDDSRLGPLPDLDDPAELVRRSLRPSAVATHDRSVTQPAAGAIYEEGHPGFAWWSTIEASWSNVTLFVERASRRLRISGTPEPLTVGHPVLVAVADRMGFVLRPAVSAR
jgi:hypothetical protein